MVRYWPLTADGRPHESAARASRFLTDERALVLTDLVVAEAVDDLDSSIERVEAV